MAESATPDSVNKDQEKSNVDYPRAVEIIQTTIHALESDQKALSKDARDAWEDIENLGVNKKGAQLFSQILKKPVDKRRDEFRTLINLAKAAGWFDWLDDLVDRAQAGPVVQAPPPAAPAPPKPAPAKAAAGKPAPPPAEPDPPADSRDLANAAVPERVYLKTGWVQRLKADAPEGCDLDNPDFWEDVRQATPAELAAERERMADFDDGLGGEPAPDVEAEKAAAAEKVSGRRGTLKIVSGGKGGTGK